ASAAGADRGERAGPTAAPRAGYRLRPAGGRPGAGGKGGRRLGRAIPRLQAALAAAAASARLIPPPDLPAGAAPPKLRATFLMADYTEADIKSLDWRDHIRLRPGMYIGKLGDGSSPDDGIYILLKEVLDNSI